MSSLLSEINHYRKESVYDNFFWICLPESNIKYEKITRKKMMEQIIQKYTPQYIVDICTVKELRFLKKVVENDYKEINMKQWSFEKMALYKKYILFQIVIPDELKESITEALEIVDFDQKEKQDEPLLDLIGYIRSCGACYPIMVEAIAKAYGLDMQTVQTSPLFNFWVYYTEDFLYPNGIYKDAFVYQDSYPYIDRISERRLKYEMITPVYLNPESYLSIFYNGYDDTDPDIHALLEYLEKFNDFKNQYKKNQLLVYIQIGYMNEQFIESYPKNHDFDQKATELFNKAIFKMAMPNLFGMTFNAYHEAMFKVKTLEKIRSNNIKQMNARIDPMDVKLFYQLYLSLLDFMNSKEKVVPNFKISQDHYVNPDKLCVVIDAFWKNPDKWIDMYIKVNPLRSTPRKLKIIQNFKYGIRKDFMIVSFGKHHTIFNDGKFNYMVKGLNSNIDEIIRADQLPIYVRTTLLPFKNNIIYDSILGSSQITLGTNISLKIFEDFVAQPKIYNLPNEKGGN